MPASFLLDIRHALPALWLLVVCATPVRANDASYRFDAVSAFDDGRYEDALAALDRGATTHDLAYLRVRVLAELGRFDEALEASRKPPSSWPPAVVRDLAELRVSWAASAGRCDAVDGSEAARSSRAGERLSARCAFAARDFARVKSLLAGARDAEGRALYIRALLELGEVDAARPLARAFYIELPVHRDAARFGELLQRKGGAVALSPEEHLARAEALLASRQPDQAVDELAPLRKVKDKKLEARIWHVRGEALFRTRKRYPEANKAFERAAKLGSESEDYDAFHAVRATSRAGDDRLAIKGYRAFASRYKKSRLAPDALFLAAWLSAREKLPNARAELKSFVESKYGAQAPGLRRDAIWHLGYQAFEKRDRREADKWLELYARAAPSTQERARAAYWQGRAALQDKDKAAARVHFVRALREERLGYYAQLAARRLIALGDPAPAAFEPAPAAIPKPALSGMPEEVGFYRELGLYEDSANAATRFLGSESDRTRRIAVLLEAGEPNRLFAAADTLMERVLEGAPDSGRSWLWQALFPRPYLRTVVEQTERNALDPALFYGHMQVESRYKPRAISGADAIGLMQLLPETAASVADELGMKFTRADLIRPYLNITWGAAYLGGLVKRYERQFPLAIAAYNGGTHKVDEWLGRADDIELDRWVESIPVEQTRNYVRRVITAWSRYHALAAPDQPWDLPLPERLHLPKSGDR